MCKVLGISRSTYYYRGKESVNYSEEAKLEEAVEDVFQKKIDRLMVREESRNTSIKNSSF